MFDHVLGMIGLASMGSFLLGMSTEGLRRDRARRRWRAKAAGAKRSSASAIKLPSAPVTDAVEQLRVVMDADFRAKPLLSRSEARVFLAAEKIVRRQGLGWRVMAQVSLGEVLTSPDPRAYSAVNSKRVDMLVVARDGAPLAAIEYQGNGHYQASACARDAVKREALRRAGVQYIEVKAGHRARDLASELERMASEAANRAERRSTPSAHHGAPEARRRLS